jgi:hypothetical protein
VVLYNDGPMLDAEIRIIHTMRSGQDRRLLRDIDVIANRE